MLNPVRRDLAADPRSHRRAPAAATRSSDLLEQVGIPRWRRDAYPHELSGGQKQRVMIAMALACDPELLIADEPTTALDVMVQAQVLQLLADLQRDRGLAMIFITHDLSVLSTVADRLAVMYAGRLVETGPAKEMLRGAKHPVHEGAGGSVPDDRRPDVAIGPVGTRRRSTRPGGGADRVPVPPAMPDRDRRVRDDRRRAPRARSRDGRRRVSSCDHAAAAGLGCQGHVPRRATAAVCRCRRSTASTSTLPPARWSPWSARAAAARPRSPARCSGLQPLTAGSISFDGAPLPTVAVGTAGVPAQGAAGLPGSDRQHQPSPIDLRDRRRGPAHPSRARRRRGAGGRGAVGLRPAPARAVLPPLPPRAVRRAAPACRDRRGDGAEAAACSSPTSRSRRSTPRCAARSCSCCSACRDERGHDDPRRHPRPRPGVEHRRPCRRDVPRPDRRGRHRPSRSSPHRSIRTRRRCCRSFPSTTGWSSRSSPARRPTRRTSPTGCRFHPRCPLYQSGEAERLGILHACTVRRSGADRRRRLPRRDRSRRPASHARANWRSICAGPHGAIGALTRPCQARLRGMRRDQRRSATRSPDSKASSSMSTHVLVGGAAQSARRDSTATDASGQSISKRTVPPAVGQSPDR